ncbi:MAG: glycosyltransferase family 2 protein [Gemmatimonadetes bacterium]|nr:MAG: glycosyltransferase family 2 protein [Gemmatimonadota bacterium]
MDISVIVPTYNRPGMLLQCLNGLFAQQIDREWEIIIIDDGSKIDLQPLIRSFDLHNRVRYHKQKNQGPAHARNTGVRLAQGEFIAFTDDDCIPEPDWLQVLWEHREEKAIVGGKTINILPNSYSEASQLLIDILYHFFEGSLFYFFTSNNFALYRDTFYAIGQFDESFPTSAGEDREFCVRALHTGYHLKFVENARLHHIHNHTLRTFWNMHFKYGTATIVYHEKIKEYETDIQLGERYFYRNLVTYPLRLKKYGWIQKMKLIGLLGLSQVAHFLGYISAYIQRRFG